MLRSHPLSEIPTPVIKMKQDQELKLHECEFDLRNLTK